jgi:predicted nucleic acid-binding protein
MNLVLDASAAAEIVMLRPCGAKFAKLVSDAEVVSVPDLYFCEVANLFWKYQAHAGLDRDQCLAALDRATLIPDEVISARELFAEAFDLACQIRHPTYDMFYLALARRHAAALATMDKKLIALSRKHKVRLAR